MPQPRDFGFGDDEKMVRDEARRFLKERLPADRLHAIVAGDPHEACSAPVPVLRWDEALWKEAAALGWTGLGVPVDAGGSGLPLVAVVALAEEAGRAALPAPLVTTLCAAEVLKRCNGSAAGAALESIAGGDAASLAIVGDTACPEGVEAGSAVRAAASASGFTLDGQAPFVQDGRKAAFFVVAARTRDGLLLARVAADAPGLAILPDRIADLTRDQARLELRGVEIGTDAVLADPADGEGALAKALPALLAIVAADIAGAAERQLQVTADYARTRRQFDHPIGFFQAVKHPLVNMMMDIDRARSLVYAAACAVDHEPDDALRLARMAKAAASDAAAFVSGRSIQLHGGIGFTWECDLHLWVKRQHHNRFLYGDGAWHRARLADAYDA